MTPYKQLFRHKPDEGTIGDCWRTCFGCLLDTPPNEVPHFLEHCWEDGLKARANALTWLATRGYSYIDAAYNCGLDELLQHIEMMNPGHYYMLGGRSPRDVGHSVIALGNKIVWDPSLDADSAEEPLIGPMKDGLYWVTWLVPLSICAPKAEVSS